MTARLAPALVLLLIVVGGPLATSTAAVAQTARPDLRPRVIVSTDLGGSDPDDVQSMVHLLMSADALDIEGLVASPWGAGRASHILAIIDAYARDYPALRARSSRYPTPDHLRAITKDGAVDPAIGSGVTRATDGSNWIVRCAKRDDPRPLWVLVWGTIDDVAQALHDDPSIAPKLRVYYIAGPNKKWGLDAYDYIERHHPDLWMIENNSTYRGWFVGGDQRGDLGNRSFVDAHVRGHGALGALFASVLDGVIKMGDTPSVAYLLDGASADPARGGWGGRFVRAWTRPKVIVDRWPVAADRVEQFGILEIVAPAQPGSASTGGASLVIDDQTFPGVRDANGRMRFRFMPKDVKVWRYEVRSSDSSLNGRTGAFTSFAPAPGPTTAPDPRYRFWWTDDPAPDEREAEHAGARTVSRFRAAFLRDFASRLTALSPVGSSR
jgi:hypothetical protein